MYIKSPLSLVNFTKRASSIPFFSKSDIGKITRSDRSVSIEKRISVNDSANHTISSIAFSFSRDHG